jgi:hypothetical protein
MWPYDYFNQYSSIEIDSRMGPRKTIFFGLWYGGKKYVKTQDNKCKSFKRIISKKIIKNITLDSIIAKETKKGDIGIDILKSILNASFVVCDITPMNENAFVLGRADPVFNQNVMYELGLATAWKMEEQVIILCDEKLKARLSKGQLPFDIQQYYIDFIDSRYDGLADIIRARYKKFIYKKDILIRNVKSKLDKESLNMLVRGYGLIFMEPYDTSTIRHLLNLGIVQTTILTLTRGIGYAYRINDLGKIILRNELHAYLFPDILIDMHWVRYCHGDKSIFEEKRAEFEKTYGLKWQEQCLDIVLMYMDKNIKAVLTKKLKLQKNYVEAKELNLDIFSHYLEAYTYDVRNTIGSIIKGREKISHYLNVN